jgi:hypothetical protein
VESDVAVLLPSAVGGEEARRAKGAARALEAGGVECGHDARRLLDTLTGLAILLELIDDGGAERWGQEFIDYHSMCVLADTETAR